MNSIIRFCLILSILFLSSYLYGQTKSEKEKLEFYKPLIQKLSKSIPKKDLEEIILNDKVQFKEKLVILNLDHPDQSGYFKRALEDERVERGYEFLKKHIDTLKKAEKKYSVDKESIVAILYIETKFDLSHADNLVFNAYASLSFANHPEYIEKNLKTLRKRYSHLSEKKWNYKKKRYIKKSHRKAKWAISELKALVKISKKMKMPILDIKGSFAGAIGWPQFLPSSYLRTAVDGNGDNFIDLFNIDDSIFSIANYLRRAGYRKSSLKKRRKAIHRYNPYREYVNFVIKYSYLLRKKQKQK